jgi:hypothetical protein
MILVQFDFNDRLNGAGTVKGMEMGWKWDGNGMEMGWKLGWKGDGKGMERIFY